MGIILALCTIIVGIYVAIDLPPIFQKKKWKEFWFYIFVTLTAYILHVLYILEVKLPSPAPPIKKLVLYVFGLRD